jgi:hypothetical protein
MTIFGQNDQVVTRQYNGSSPVLLSGTFPYGLVPNTTTQIDQLRAGLDLSPCTRFYTLGYWGHTDDFARSVMRDFGGADWRLTNSSLNGQKLTAYGRLYYQTGVRPPGPLPDELQGLTPQQADENIPRPFGYLRSTVGVQDRWMPRPANDLFHDIAFTSGYEFDYLSRRNASFDQSSGAFTFQQPDTITHTFHIGVQEPWTQWFSTSFQYKALFISGPLYGFREDSGELNSNQPQQRQIFEFSETWAPGDRFTLIGDQQFDFNWHKFDSPFIPDNKIRFNEQNYAITTTLWYAATQKLSFALGSAFFNNWINQNIVLGTDYVEPGAPPGRLITPVTRPWQYGGTSSSCTVHGNYLVCPNVRLSGGYEYVVGLDQIFNSGFADLWPDLARYSRVVVITHRVFAGIDWSPRERLHVYFRYNLFDYEDKAAPYNTGSLHTFLLGGSAFF